MLEVLWEDFLAKKIRVFDYEAFAVGLCPPDNVLGLLDVNYLVKFHQERRHMVD